MLLLWLTLQSLSVSPVGPAVVHLEADLFGARMSTPVTVANVAAPRDPAGLLQANSVAMADIASWVELSAEAVDLDDYGRFRLVVAAVDALPVSIEERSGARRTVPMALRETVWTADERLLAIGGGLRALGVAATVFKRRGGALALGVSCDDRTLNVNAIEHRWQRVLGGRAVQSHVRWVLWDGSAPIGSLSAKGLVALESSPASGRALRLADPRPPAFTLTRTLSTTRPVRGGQPELRVKRFPDAAGWLSLAPEQHLTGGLAAARAHVRRAGLVAEVRRRTRGLSGEAAHIDAVIRFVQGAFVYEPGPVRTLPELLETGRGDCDQLSLLVAAILLEVGYAEEDLVVVSWPDHLGLAVRPREGQGPRDAAALNLAGGRYVLLDVTHYMWRGQVLESRWGRTSPSHGTQVTVQRLH